MLGRSGKGSQLSPLVFLSLSRFTFLLLILKSLARDPSAFPGPDLSSCPGSRPTFPSNVGCTSVQCPQVSTSSLVEASHFLLRGHLFVNTSLPLPRQQNLPLPPCLPHCILVLTFITQETLCPRLFSIKHWPKTAWGGKHLFCSHFYVITAQYQGKSGQ